MNCRELKNNSTAPWINCNNSSISNSIFFQSLPESIFDIEVNASNNQQIQQFKGSEQGTAIENLEPGTYIVNEIKHLTDLNQLGANAGVEQSCKTVGFPDGGGLLNSTASISYR